MQQLLQVSVLGRMQGWNIRIPHSRNMVHWEDHACPLKQGEERKEPGLYLSEVVGCQVQLPKIDQARYAAAQIFKFKVIGKSGL